MHARRKVFRLCRGSPDFGVKAVSVFFLAFLFLPFSVDELMTIPKVKDLSILHQFAYIGAITLAPS
jgi:hypothetical protein